MEDKKAYITVKKARIARAGKQIYTAGELYLQGIALKDGKEYGVVYRPPETLIKNKDKFANVPFVDDHTPVDVTPDNWKEFTVGFVGSSTDIEVFNDEVWLTGDVIFYDQKAYEEYKNGKVELSASYDVKLGVPDNPDAVGYDAILLDIPAVNHVALCDKARAGHDARVLDSLNVTGGNDMKIMNGFLSLFGIGKSNDANFKFSKILMDSVAKISTLKPDDVQKEVDGVLAHVTSLGDSTERALLIGAVSDCYKHSAEVLAKKDEISAKLDELYIKCQDADAAVAARILDAGKKVEGEPAKEGDKRADDSKTSTNDKVDVGAVVEAAIAKSLASLSDSIDKKIDDAMKKALGVDDTKDDKKKDSSPVLDSGDSADASFLMRGVFGNR